MTPVTSAAGQHFALFGLGGSGLATARALLAGGARVTAWDDGEDARATAVAAGIAVADLRRADWSGFTALVLSPGVPLTHPAPHWSVDLARQAGVEVIGDIDLFCRERAKLAPEAPFVAVTGTNGKSTTTALVAHLFRTAGWDVQMGGNIGTAVLDLEPPSDERIHVLELSSFQIELAPSLKPSLGILTNITPDHIDRHGTLERYAAIKESLIERSEWSLVGVDDHHSRAIHDRAVQRAEATAAAGGSPGPQYAVSVRDGSRGGVHLAGTKIVMAIEAGRARLLGDLAGTQTLRGAHNAQNACFAAGAADCWELWANDAQAPVALIQHGLQTFEGLPHRMETMAKRGRVLFVNDSKATNAEAAAQSLRTFADIHWIVGGLAKEGGLSSLWPEFGRVRKAYLIGASTEAFAAEIGDRLPVERCGTLERAVAMAAADAARSEAAEPVVLLAPACASYDQFKNFEARGEAFRTLVQGLGSDP